jgi:hypothetical protein
MEVLVLQSIAKRAFLHLNPESVMEEGRSATTLRDVIKKNAEFMAERNIEAIDAAEGRG